MGAPLPLCSALTWGLASLPEDLEKAFGLCLPALGDVTLAEMKGDTLGWCEFLELYLGMVGFPLQRQHGCFKCLDELLLVSWIFSAAASWLVVSARFPLFGLLDPRARIDCFEDHGLDIVDL